jgi:hypothetical protein
MPKFLVVAHQTALSPELLEAVQTKMAAHPGALFDILVPATPVEHLLVWEEGETREIALRHASEVSARLTAAGVDVGQALIGDPSPLAAIRDHLRKNPDTYKGLLIATHPPPISRWLRIDLLNQAARLSGLPVTHIVARSTTAKSENPAK